jgi:hypothetical protein
MCSTTGSGEAKNRALAGVTSALLASSVKRNVPATPGTKLSRMSEAGIHHSAEMKRFSFEIIENLLGVGSSERKSLPSMNLMTKFILNFDEIVRREFIP